MCQTVPHFNSKLQPKAVSLIRPILYITACQGSRPSLCSRKAGLALPRPGRLPENIKEYKQLKFSSLLNKLGGRGGETPNILHTLLQMEIFSHEHLLKQKVICLLKMFSQRLPTIFLSLCPRQLCSSSLL